MKTKLFSLFLALVASVGSIYADSVKIGDLYYYLDAGDKTASVEVYPLGRKYSRDITIPASVTFNAETYSVTSIGNGAFKECENLTSIEIPNSVSSIGEYAFEECTGLKSVTIPNSVTSIGHRVFDGCTSLESVTIPNSVTSIGFLAFFGCNSLPVINNLRYADTYLVEAVDQTLTSYTIKEGTKWIGDAAFHNCSNLTSITIPNSVTNIGEIAFYGCTSLPVINNLRYADTYLVGAVDKKLTTCTIKEGTIWIGDFAFEDCKGLTSVAMPNSVIRIGYEAFSGCKGLTSVTIPNSVTSIGDFAFENCSSLTSVTIPNSVTSIGSEAFSGCTGLISVTIPNSVTSIGNYAFENCSSLTSPLYNAHIFAYMPTSYSGAYTIPDGIESIAGGAFGCILYSCKGLTSVTICNSVTSIGEYAFSYCTGLTSVTIPNSVTSIGQCAFYRCTGLTSVTIGNGVTRLERYTFGECTGLTSVTIGNGVTNIGSEAFYHCTGLTSVTCYATTPPSLGYKVFIGVDCSQIPLYVPQESIDTYKAANQWKEFNPILPIQNPEGIDNVNSSVKQNTSKLIRDGKVYILHGDKTYTLTGQDVK